jgi:trehalose synthase
MVALLRDEPRAHALGASGRERVRRPFLIPRLLLDELSLMRRLATGAAAGRAFERASHHDPVCGMAVEAAEETMVVDGQTLRFCSAQCHAAFMATPERYLDRVGDAPAGPPGAGDLTSPI